MKNQADTIYEHLKAYGSITTWEAIREYGITRLSAMIYILKKEGYKIISEWEEGTSRTGRKVKWKKYILM